MNKKRKEAKSCEFLSKIVLNKNNETLFDIINDTKYTFIKFAIKKLQSIFLLFNIYNFGGICYGY